MPLFSFKMLHSYALEFYLASEQYEDPWNYTWLYKDKGSERVKGVLARLYVILNTILLLLMPNNCAVDMIQGMARLENGSSSNGE